MGRVLKKSGQLGKTNWDAVIRVYDEAGNVIRNARASGRFQRVVSFARITSPFPVKEISHDSAFIGFFPGEQAD